MGESTLTIHSMSPAALASVSSQVWILSQLPCDAGAEPVDHALDDLPVITEGPRLHASVEVINGAIGSH